jgi:hypothetical protein
MQKAYKTLIMTLALVFCLSLAAQADQIAVKTVDLSNTNLITAVNGTKVNAEIYNLDLFLIDITLKDFKPKKGDADFNMGWQITNKTGSDWSEYNFIIEAAPLFTYKGTNYAIGIGFDHPAASGEFVVDGLVANGHDLNAHFKILLTGFPDTGKEKINYTFTMGQHDSPRVPIPGTVLLLGSSLLGLVGWRRLRKS